MYNNIKNKYQKQSKNERGNGPKTVQRRSQEVTWGPIFSDISPRAFPTPFQRRQGAPRPTPQHPSTSPRDAAQRRRPRPQRLRSSSGSVTNLNSDLQETLRDATRRPYEEEEPYSIEMDPKTDAFRGAKSSQSAVLPSNFQVFAHGSQSLIFLAK